MKIKLFENFSKVDPQQNIDELKRYIKILKGEFKNGRNYDFAIRYFTIIHNFIIIEQGFIDDYILKKDQINLNLKLKHSKNYSDIYDEFLELYDPSHKIRNNVENFDRNWEIIKNYLKTKTDIYTKLLNTTLHQSKKDVEMFINMSKYNL